MSEKVVITKKQAEAIELFIASGHWDKKDILVAHGKNIHGWDKYKGINGMEFDTLAKALYIGYEVEPTPEDIIRNRYLEAKRLRNCCIHKDYNQGQIDGIEMVLRTLKIKIEIKEETN